LNTQKKTSATQKIKLDFIGKSHDTIFIFSQNKTTNEENFCVPENVSRSLRSLFHNPEFKGYSANLQLV